MKPVKKARLEAAGWKFGSPKDFLGLSPEEAAYMEMKMTLSLALQEKRRRKRMTQVQLAKMIQSSQSRVAKMEAGDPSVSLDLLVRSLLALGVSGKSLLRTIPA